MFFYGARVLVFIRGSIRENALFSTTAVALKKGKTLLLSSYSYSAIMK
jgi:hypothetical protein